MAMVRAHVLCCAGTGCTSSKSPEIMAEFERQLAAHGLADEVQIVKTGCFGLCAKGPIVVIYPEGAFYSHVSVGDVEEIVTEHLLKGRIVQRLLFTEDDEKSQQISNFTDTDFYRSQVRIALRNCGRINPEDIDEYIGHDGYEALAKVLTEMTPQQVIDEIWGDPQVSKEFADVFTADGQLGRSVGVNDVGMTVIELTDEATAEFKVAADQYAENWVKNQTTSSFDAQSYLDLMLSIKEELEG